MASFTGVGDSVSLTVPEKGEDILVSISGTYSMVIELQLKVGEGAWKNLLTFNTENATEASYYTTKNHGENLRLIVTTDTSGTAVSTLVDKSDKVLHTFGGIGISNPIQVKQTGIDLNGRGCNGKGITSYAASQTLTREANAGRITTMNIASGATFTLPAATGTGDEYIIFIGTTIGSNSAIIAVASSSDILAGGVSIATDIGGGVMLTAATTDTITMSGSTTGGVKGSWVKVTDVTSGIWMLDGFLISTGSEATPFSAAV